MKQSFSALALASILCLFIQPTMAQIKGDTLIVKEPSSVRVISQGNSIDISIEGSADNPQFKYHHQVFAPSDASVMVTEQKEDWVFNIPFTKEVKKKKGPRKECRLHMFGLGGVTSIGGPDNMSIDMGSSFEILGPTLDVAYYPFENSSVSFSFGMGCNWRNYKMTGRTRFIRATDGTLTVGAYPEGADVNYSRIRIFSWTIPVFINGDFSKNIGYSLGPVLNYNTRGRLRTEYTLDGRKVVEKSYNIHQNRLTVDLMAHLEIASIGFYVKYTPTKILDTTYGPDFKGLSMGVTFGW